MNQDKAAVERMAEKYIDIVNQNDIDALIKLYDENAAALVISALNPDGPPAREYQLLTSLKAIRETLAGLLTVVTHVTFHGAEAIVSGDTALCVVDATIEGKDEHGKPWKVSRRRSIDVLRRNAAGDWKFTIDNGVGALLLDMQRVDAT